MSERYCPECGQEFEDWVKICPDCGSTLQDGPVPEVAQEPPHEFTEYSLLGHVGTLGEAYVIKAVLAGEGIPLRVDNDAALNAGMWGVGMPVGGIRLFVPVEVYDESVRLLAEHRSAPLAQDAPAQDESGRETLWRFYHWFVLSFLYGLTFPIAMIFGVRAWKRLRNQPIHPIHRVMLYAGTVIALAAGITLVVLFGGMILERMTQSW